MIAALGLDRFHALEIEFQVVAQAAVENAGAGAAGLGRQHVAIAGHADHRAGHGIEHAFAVRLGHDDAVRIDRRLRIDRKILHPAIGEHEADGLGFLLRDGGGGIGVRDQRAVDDAALAAPVPLAAGKRLQQPRGAALGGGRKRVVADFDGPGALADGDAGQRGLVLGIEPALRGGRLRRQRQQRGGAEAKTKPERAKWRCRRSRMAGPGIGANCVHLSRNIRQTTRTLRRKRHLGPRMAGSRRGGQDPVA